MPNKSASTNTTSISFEFKERAINNVKGVGFVREAILVTNQDLIVEITPWPSKLVSHPRVRLFGACKNAPKAIICFFSYSKAAIRNLDYIL